MFDKSNKQRMYRGELNWIRRYVHDPKKKKLIKKLSAKRSRRITKQKLKEIQDEQNKQT